MAVTKTASDQLARIKKNVSTAYMYFNENYKRYREFRKYVFRESINERQRAVLQQLNRPVVEFNILEAYISRLLGEFSQHEPGIEVSPAEGIPVGQQVLDVVEGHLRHILHDANKNNFSYEIYKDLLSGGFSIAKVWTDYASPMSFNQQIYLARVFDPTMCGFDPMARHSHKGDGQFSFEIYPMLEEEFLREFPNAEIRNVGYTRDIEGFNWTYKNVQGQKIILVADYYEKKRKKVKIVKLANGRVMTAKNYEKLEAYWAAEQFIEQIPAIVGAPRVTELETICRYKLIEDQVLEYNETDYSYLPHVFIDGNSILLTQGTANTTYQMTRPYVYHARGIQDMMNYGGQTICNSMENLIQHKFIVMKEAIPQEQDFVEALNDIQRASTVVLNAFHENNPEQPIPNPIREVQNIPLPPEVMGAFQVTGPMTQAILGSFTSNLNQENRNLSGRAVIESASADNAAAMPYVVGYLAGLNQIGNICVDLMPKYLLGKRTIPIESKGGEKTYQEINAPNRAMVNYDEKAIKVNINAGVNFQVQKSQAMTQIIGLMQASEEFSKFMNSEQGLKILVKNLTIYGSDELQEAVPQWLQQQQQQQQQAMQMAQQQAQNDPRMIKAQADMQKVQIQGQSDQLKTQLEAMRLQFEQQQQEFDNQIAIAKMANEKILNDSKMLEAEAKVNQMQIDSAVRLEESQTSLERHALDAAAKMAEVKSREHHDNLATHQLAHTIRQATKETISDE
jgi:hypothetical protein